LSFGILNLAKNTLLSQQMAMQIIGHNVANAQTEGYVRQVPVITPMPGALQGTIRSGIGQGAILSAVKRLQNSFLAVQQNRQMALLGQERGANEILSQVEAIFTEFGESGLVDTLNQLFSAFAQIAIDPASLAPRQEAVVRAQMVADILNDRVQNMYDLRTEIDARLTDNIREANELAHQIVGFNTKITEASNDAVRNDLKSLREAAMSRLAELTGAYSIEQENQQIDVMIGGHRMVQLGEVIELTLEPDGASPGMHKVCLGEVEDPQGLGGVIRGRLDARDAQIIEYIQRLDTFVATLVDELNTIHQSGFDLYGAAGGNFFEYDPTAPAATLTVTSSIVADPSTIAAAKVNDASGDGANASEMGQIRTTKLFEGGLVDASGYYADLIGQIGTDAMAAADMMQAREVVVNNLRANYQSLSGVSLDEEATNLLRYQQIYTAATRLIQVSMEMMDALFTIG